MESFALEWLNLVLRWVHVIAAIMWIGDSFLFMWMDRHLTAPRPGREGTAVGELWMVHSGGFYEVVKRRSLARHELPSTLHWFKWEAYTTWWSGFLLLGVVYYLSRGAYLIEGPSAPLGVGAAIALSLGLLGAGWIAYDLLWRSLSARPRVAAAASVVLLVVAAIGLTRLFSGRAAFLQLGAMMGTIMAANVWRVIIPAQRHMLASTRAGEPVDTSWGVRAKTRSIHNHYMTLPVLFTMLSNHFPSTYGHPLNWLVLILLVAVGAAAKYVMTYRAASSRLVMGAGLASVVALLALTAPRPWRASATSGHGERTVSFAEVHGIVERRCLSCHAARPANPSFPQPAGGVVLEDPERIQKLAPRILARAVETETMPLGNLTGMTQGERDTLGAWIAQGANLEGLPHGSR